mgnify:FL=1
MHLLMKGTCILIIGSFMLLAAASCGEDAAPARYTPEQFRHTVDSTIAARIPEIRKELREDYEMRKAIILKSVQDSIKGTGQSIPAVIIPGDALLKDTSHDETTTDTGNQ